MSDLKWESSSDGSSKSITFRKSNGKKCRIIKMKRKKSCNSDIVKHSEQNRRNKEYVYNRLSKI